MTIAFGLNWLYFDVDNSNLESHAIRRHILSSMVYGLAHLPFIMVSSRGKTLLIIGTYIGWCSIRIHRRRNRLSRCQNRRFNRRISKPFITHRQRWSPMVLLRRSRNIPILHGYPRPYPPQIQLMSGIISLSHVHFNSEYLNLRKRYRLGIRASICLIIACLPLVNKLNSLQLIGTVAALLWFIVGIETWGNAEKCHVWIGDKMKHEYVCKYNIRCVQGEEVDIEDRDEEEDDGDVVFRV